MRTKATIYNSITNLILYFFTILLGIINRWAIIKVLGIEYQGINSLFANILSMLSIAELGLGGAIVYHLYKPLEEKKISELKSLMQFYRKCYYTIAIIILCLGIMLIPFLHFFVTENPTKYPISFIYLWFLLDVVISYSFTFKRSILIADQKNYIITICDIFYQIAVKIGQVVVLLVTESFIGFLALMLLCRIIENLMINIIANRIYPFLKDRDVDPISRTLLLDIKLKVKGAFFHKIGGFVVLGTDNLLISKFLGLTMVGIYSNYYLIINAIQNICSKTLTAATASIGHMLTENNSQKARLIFSELLIGGGLLITVGASGIYCIATPFITLVFGEVYTIPKFTLFILVINMYLQGMRIPYSVFKDAAGILYEDRFVPLVESFVNIFASIIFVKLFGLAGIFLGTIVSTMILYSYTFPFLIIKGILKMSIKKYWLTFYWMLATVLMSMNSCEYICATIHKIFSLKSVTIGSIIIDFIAVVIISLGVYSFFFAIWEKESRELIKKFKKILILK